MCHLLLPQNLHSPQGLRKVLNLIHIEIKEMMVVMAHICNPSTSGWLRQEDHHRFEISYTHWSRLFEQKSESLSQKQKHQSSRKQRKCIQGFETRTRTLIVLRPNCILNASIYKLSFCLILSVFCSVLFLCLLFILLSICDHFNFLAL